MQVGNYILQVTFSCKMVLFENSVVKLDYDPTTDILVVEYPDLHDYLLSEVKHSIDKMLQIIRSYDIKYLLLDSTRTVSSVEENESREVATYLAAGIMKTRVLKVARVQSPMEAVEKRAQCNIKHIQESLPLPFQLKNFTEKAVALEWLQVNKIL